MKANVSFHDKMPFLVTRPLRRGGGKVGPLIKKNFLKLEKKISEIKWPLSSRGGIRP